MSLKVIGGEFRGRNLQSVKGVGTRPLLGQVREALFNILADRIEGREVWDLFAGTGVSGIEALSRGAARVIFVEKNNQALRVLESNLELLGEEVEGRYEVVKGDAWKPRLFLQEDGGPETPPGLVFFDPPYKAVTEDPTRAAYLAQELVQRLAPGGTICFHFLDGNLDRDDFEPDLDVEIRRWGKSAIALIRAAAAARGASTQEIEDAAGG